MKLKKTISVLLAVCLMALCVPIAAQAAGNGKALQLVENGAAANVEGAQASSVYFGNYMQSSADGKEPVKWRVLSNADGKLFLLSDQNLDVVRYNEKYTSVTWETCTLRKWLNGYDGDPYADSFIGSAFSGKEAAAIAETAVVNDDNPTSGTPGGNDTTDKVFLLSIAEAKNTAYGFTDNNGDTDTRVATNTEYVHSGGHTHSGMYAVGEADWWWLRSPGLYSDYAAYVHSVGSVMNRGRDVNSDDAAVRPAFKLNLNSVIFTSAAAGGKISAAEGGGPGGEAAPNIFEISDFDGSEWKLTLLDADRAFAVTETAATVVSGGSVTLNYTGAATGENEYVSVILTDADGSAVYYGRLAQPDAADGSATVILPELPTGSYTLKVFSEQYNGDYKTDYASAFCDVALTVATQLDIDKAAAKAELENYKDPADYRTDEQAALAAAIGDGKAAIDAAADSEAVATALANAKTAIDAIKTDAQLTAEETYAALAAAGEVITLIEAIGEVEYTAACKAKIDAAKDAYEALTADQKALVTNYATLTAAEARYAELKAQAEAPTDHTEPENPTEPTDPDTPSGGSECKWCGETHTGFWGAIVRFFHSILYFFAHLFGRR